MHKNNAALLHQHISFLLRASVFIILAYNLKLWQKQPFNKVHLKY